MRTRSNGYPVDIHPSELDIRWVSVSPMGFRKQAVRRGSGAPASQSAGAFDAKCQKSLSVTLGKSNRSKEKIFRGKDGEIYGGQDDILCAGRWKHGS